MKYKAGDKVKYDSGDWWFYGTVTAVIENSINPCYRLNVDRMVKKNCKFSITQFEFELEADNGDDSDRDWHKWESSELEYLKKYFEAQNNEELSKVIKQEPIPESTPIPAPMPLPEHVSIQVEATEPVPSEPKPEKKQRKKRQPKPKPAPEPKPEKVEVRPTVKEKKPRQKRGDAWDRNLELYQSGDKSNVVYTWISQNRRLYKTGKLKEDKFEKLMEINFPFDIKKKERPENS